MYAIRSYYVEINDLIFRGSYPRIYDQGIRPETFYKNYISTYIEKDVSVITSYSIHYTKLYDMEDIF